MNYGHAIRLVRSARGTSQRSLAEKLGIDPSTVSHLERQERQPSTEMLEAISGALGIPTYLLVFLASEEKDLKGLPPEHSKLFGQELLRIFTDTFHAK
jgi:transcriptional regulator with XRE-family HTH domain